MTQTALQPIEKKANKLAETHADIFGQIANIYTELFNHDGYGDFRVEMKILRRGQKEIIIHCGKQHRFVVDCDSALKAENPLKALLKRDILA
ncbi:MAG: hypothetical protein COB45_10225 [Gammaproteobacteria bacterium]|nr:MAG: hypothetical protein COB45_10225 [Gammaproteobacteria bacterium]